MKKAGAKTSEIPEIFTALVVGVLVADPEVFALTCVSIVSTGRGEEGPPSEGVENLEIIGRKFALDEMASVSSNEPILRDEDVEKE